MLFSDILFQIEHSQIRKFSVRIIFVILLQFPENNFYGWKLIQRASYVSIFFSYTHIMIIWINNVKILETFAVPNGLIDLFGAVHGWRGEKPPLSKICYAYPAVMKLGRVLHYLKKIQKLFTSRDIPLDFTWNQKMSLKIDTLARPS